MGEFAFHKFPGQRRSPPSKTLGGQFYINLQHEVQDWLALGVTKTAMVYRLKGQRAPKP